MPAGSTGMPPRRSRRWASAAASRRRIEALVAQVAAAARPGDHIVCMSNGGFGGVHDKLLAALGAKAPAAPR